MAKADSSILVKKTVRSCASISNLSTATVPVHSSTITTNVFTLGLGNIGVDELEEPLVALGLAQSRENVQQLFDMVDEDGSGQIEFEEFLALMSEIKNNPETKDAPIFGFFNGMLDGKLPEGMDKAIPFQLNVSQYRRKRILG